MRARKRPPLMPPPSPTVGRALEASLCVPKARCRRPRCRATLQAARLLRVFFACSIRLTLAAGEMKSPTTARPWPSSTRHAMPQSSSAGRACPGLTANVVHRLARCCEQPSVGADRTESGALPSKLLPAILR
ncbi:hypothetical protein PSPO01_00470 [Paraphaeosphaeria sporulosa]